MKLMAKYVGQRLRIRLVYSVFSHTSGSHSQVCALCPPGAEAQLYANTWPPPLLLSPFPFLHALHDAHTNLTVSNNVSEASAQR